MCKIGCLITPFCADRSRFQLAYALAHRERALYREFAIERINKGFLPADFVAYLDNDSNEEGSPTDSASSGNTTGSSSNADVATEVDLSGQRYLFTGKMQSMTRGEAGKSRESS